VVEFGEVFLAKLTGGRPSFREWVDRQSAPADWKLMPLTHITKGVGAEDIIRSGEIAVTDCTIFEEPLAYFFYGRPAYRIANDGAVRTEVACPFCFIFDSSLIEKAKAIFAFDTGAFSNRLLTRFMAEEMNVEDFSLENDASRPNKIIAKVFSSRRSYFDGDLSKAISPELGAEAWDFHALT